MDKKYFCDLLFQIFNENDKYFLDIEWLDSGNCFIITCTDNSKFSISINGVITYHINSFVNDITPINKELPKYLRTNENYFHDLINLRQDNPYLFMILLSILKLRDFDILSHDMAESIISQLRPYAQKLKDDWNF